MTLTDYTSLRAYAGTETLVQLTGTVGAPKPGGIVGNFFFDPTDTTSLDNGGTIIVGNDGRRWKRQYDTLNPERWGADRTGTTDSSAALSSMWAVLKASRTQPEANQSRVNFDATVPAGKYLINTSVNWTGLLTWNVHINLNGAVFIAGNGCAGKAMFDASNTRGLHIFGGMIESTVTIANAPFAGLFVGNSGTATCGNNRFEDLKIMGRFTYAPYVNIGSETTYYYNCYFAQTAEDTASVQRYSTVFDGQHSNPIVVSDYTTLRASLVAVSFTNNKFYGCHFRNYGSSGTNGGSAVYLRSNAYDWEWDGGCYFLAFDKANIEIYCDPIYRPTALKFSGLYETTQGAGVKNVVRFIVPDGTSSAIDGFKLITAGPHATESIFKMVDTSGDTTTGTLKLTRAEIEISSIGGTLFNQCAGLSVYGKIGTRSSANCNIKDIQRFKGDLFVMDKSAMDFTGVLSKEMSFRVIDETPTSGAIWYPASTEYTFEATSTGNDAGFRFKPKGAGRFVVEGISQAGISQASSIGYSGFSSIATLTSGVANIASAGALQFNLSSSQTLTGLVDSGYSGAPLILIRNVASFTLTIQHSATSLRLLQQTDVVLQTNDTILFVKITTGIYQQVAGKVSDISTSSTGIGYGTGSGGAITQTTSKNTGVTLNKPCGRITMHAASLTAGASVSFTLTNSTISPTDTLILGFDSASPAPANQSQNYRTSWEIGETTGSATITVQNISNNSLSEAVKLRFAIMKAMNS